MSISKHEHEHEHELGAPSDDVIDGTAEVTPRFRFALLSQSAKAAVQPYRGQIQRLLERGAVVCSINVALA